MTVVGTTRKCRSTWIMAAFGSKADSGGPGKPIRDKPCLRRTVQACADQTRHRRCRIPRKRVTMVVKSRAPTVVDHSTFAE
jgi:hypothetical protein